MVKKFVFIHMRVNIHIRAGVLLVSIGSQTSCSCSELNINKMPVWKGLSNKIEKSSMPAGKLLV